MQIQTAHTDFHTGQITVGTSPTVVVLPEDFRDRIFHSVVLKANSENEGTIYIAPAKPREVSSADFPLDAGQQVEIFVDQLSKLKLTASESGQILHWLSV